MPALPQGRSDRFLTFGLAGQLYALRSDEVQEVIRVPAIARVPQAPEALLGVANLRGAVLPVIALHVLLGKPAPLDTSATRAIVLDIGAAAALVVDSVAALEVASAEQIDIDAKETAAAGAELLTGIFSTGVDKRSVKILDVKPLLDRAFAQRRTQVKPPGSGAGARAAEQMQAMHAEETEMLVTFEVAGQEFALPLAQVQEILPAPAAVTAVPQAEAVVIGLTAVRDKLLPLLSLRALLGLTARAESSERAKVVVVKLNGTHFGLVADRARAIIAAPSKLVDAVPAVLAARAGGESRIRSVYRGDAGRRLISILSPQHLFREDVMQRLLGQRSAQNQDAQQSATSTRAADSIFLVFRLGQDEYGLPIDSVVEVARVPDEITRVPKTPKFLEGIVNLRGEVVPVIDQRRRFDLPPREKTAGRRMIVVTTERHRAGLIVDSVSDVLRSHVDDIKPAPQLTDETSRLVRGIINLAASNRIVLILDPTELLTRAEQGLLDKFKAERPRAGA